MKSRFQIKTILSSRLARFVPALACAASSSWAQVDLSQFNPDVRIIDYSVYTTDSIWLPSGSGLANGGLFGSAGSVHLADGMSLRAPRINVGENFTLGANSKSPWGIPSFYAGGNFQVSAGSVFNDSFQVDGNFTSVSPDLIFRKALAVKGNLNFTGTNIRDSALLRLAGTYNAPGMTFGPAATVEMAAASGGPDLPGRVTYNKPWSQLQLLQTPMFPNLSTNLPGGQTIPDYNPPATRPNIDLSGPSVAGDAAVQFLSPTTTTARYWKCSQAGLPAGSCNGDTLLPGYYGDLDVTGNGRAILLTEGFYSFTSISIGGGNAIVAAQPRGSRTVVLSEGDVTAASSHAFIGPDSGRMATGYGSGPNEFLGGTMMLISLSDITIPSDNRIWATLSAPYGEVHMANQVRLYGQVFAKRLIGDNNIDFGEGAFIKIRTEMPALQPPVFSVGERFDPACVDPSGLRCRDTLVTVRIPFVTAYTVTGRYTLVESSPRRAKVGTDFPALTDTFSIPKGTLTTQIRVRVFDDSSYEGPETFRVAFSDLHAALCPDAKGNGDTAIKVCHGTGTIVDDEKAPIVRILADSSVLEGNSGTKPLSFTVRLYDPITKTDTLSAKNAPELAVRFKWRTADGTALVSDADYVAQAPRWDTIPALGLTKSISVQVRGDVRYEYDDWFTVVADSVRNGAIDGAASDSGIIRNDDAMPSLSIASFSVQEPATFGDTAWAVFKLRLSDASGVPTSVWWSTGDSTAKATTDFAATPLDFLKSTGQAVIPADTLEREVRVAVFGDTLFEKSEIFRIVMDSVRDAAALGQGIGTILDADSAPAVHVLAATVREPLTGTTFLRFGVRLDRPSGLASSLEWSTADGSAKQVLDYLAVVSRKLELPAFLRDTVIEVEVLADSVAGEGDETMTVALSNLVDLGSGTGSATGTIQDAQDGFILTIDSVGPVAEADSVVHFVVRTNWIPAFDIRMGYHTREGTAKNGFRYADTSGVFTLDAGSRSGSIAVRITRDSLWGPMEQFSLWLDSIVGANAPVTTDSTARAWIYEGEDLTFWFDSPDTSVREDSAGRVTAWIRASQPPSIPISFRLPLLPGSSATLPADVMLTTEGSVWPANERRYQFAVLVQPDAIVEEDEIASVGFEPLTAGRLTGRDAWNLTILDDDHLLVVVIQTPPNGTRTNQTDWPIEWTVDATKQPTTDTTFKVEGFNDVVRCATDRFGREFCDTNTIWLDTTPPKIEVFKITGPNPHDKSIDTTWWGDRAKTRYGQDTIWYWTRDSIKNADGSGWRVIVDTLSVVTDFWGDGDHPTQVKYCDSVGNCAVDTGWIELRVVIPRADGGYYLDRDHDGRIDALVVELSNEWNADFWPTFDAPLPPELREGLMLDSTKPFLTRSGAPDYTRLVVPVVEPFRYGVTSWDSLHGVMWENWTLGVPKPDSFLIRDSVAPVIVKSVLTRTEDYNRPDTLVITPSEPLVTNGKDWLEVGQCPDGQKTCSDSELVWNVVPADSVHLREDGRYWFLVPPGEDGSVVPGYKTRLTTGVSDTLGNANDTAKTNWANLVEGAPRPELVQVTVNTSVVYLPQNEIKRKAPGDVLLHATSGSLKYDSISRKWWEPGRGYIPDNDPRVQSACPDLRYCNGPRVYINRPVRMIIYIYDNAGTFVMSRTIDITQADLANMNPDQLDRISIDLQWNHRTMQGNVVAGGVYIWRIVSYIRINERSAPIMQNQLFKLGVRAELEDGFF